MEWFALLIPIIAGGVVYKLHPHRVVWWEAVLPILPPLLLIPLVRQGAIYAVCRDTERWGGWVVSATYYEDWNEYIHRTCTRTVGSGNSQRIETYDCSYVAYHGPEWVIKDSNGQTHAISADTFEHFCAKFGNRKFVDMHRHYHTNDGDSYVTTWPGKDVSFTPVFTEHSYVNQILGTHGVLGFPDVKDPKQLGLYEYPPWANLFHDPAVLGNAPGSPRADEILQRANAKLGAKKELRMWLLLFHDKPLRTGVDQESYWQGGNKNEFVVCLGLNRQHQIQWCYPFCWIPDGNTSNTELKVNVRNFAMTQPQLPAFAEYMAAQADRHFVRKEFDKELAYVHVDCPMWAMILIYVLTSLATGLVAYVVVHNETVP